MHSSNQEDAKSSDNPEITKLPFKRISHALDQIIKVGIPLHTQLLKEKSEQIEQIKCLNSSTGLHAEQSDAAKYLKLLKADLSELETLNLRVEEKDQELFYSKIKDPIKDAIETVAKFMELHPDALEPFPFQDELKPPEIPPVICYLDQKSEDNEIECPASNLPVCLQKQSKPTIVTGYLTSASAFPDWSALRREILEVNSLIRHFTSLIFSQQKSVDTIQNNVEDAQENVQEGVAHLKKASVLKAASFPLFGAIVGGAVLGPVGFFAGLKIAGTITAIASGTAVGYKVGSSLKKKHEVSCDIEMKALTYPARQKSTSNPELSFVTEGNK